MQCRVPAAEGVPRARSTTDALFCLHGFAPRIPGTESRCFHFESGGGGGCTAACAPRRSLKGGRFVISGLLRRTAGGDQWRDSVDSRRLTLNRRRLALNRRRLMANRRPLMANRQRLAHDGLQSLAGDEPALCGSPRVPEAGQCLFFFGLHDSLGLRTGSRRLMYMRHPCSRPPFDLKPVAFSATVSWTRLSLTCAKIRKTVS